MSKPELSLLLIVVAVACAMAQGFLVGSSKDLPQPTYMHRNLMAFGLSMPIIICVLFAFTLLTISR